MKKNLTIVLAFILIIAFSFYYIESSKKDNVENKNEHKQQL